MVVVLVELVAGGAVRDEQRFADRGVDLGYDEFFLVTHHLDHRLGVLRVGTLGEATLLGGLLDLRSDRGEVGRNGGDVFGLQLLAEHRRLVEHPHRHVVPALRRAGLGQYGAHVVTDDALLHQHLAPALEPGSGGDGLDVHLIVHELHVGEQLAHALEILRVGGSSREVVRLHGVGHREGGEDDGAQQEA